MLFVSSSVGFSRVSWTGFRIQRMLLSSLGECHQSVLGSEPGRHRWKRPTGTGILSSGRSFSTTGATTTTVAAAATATTTTTTPNDANSAAFPTTPDICDDCIDTIRVVDPSLGFRNLGGRTRFGGRAVTVKCHEDNSMIKHLAKNVDGRGRVIVVDGGGSRRRALLGDMVASDCIDTGWEGLVIYGSIRDVEEISRLKDLGVQALGSHPIPTIKRNEGQIDVPVTFGGVTISSGDWIVCDNNGIVVNETDPREARDTQQE